MTDQPTRSPIPEPPIDAGDTPPSGMSRVREGDTQPTRAVAAPTRGGAGVAQMALYAVAALITAAAAFVYLQPTPAPVVLPTATTAATPADSVAATEAPTLDVTATSEIGQFPTQTPLPASASIAQLPTDPVPVDVIADLLRQPGDTAPPADAIYRQQSAYTIAPVRPRSTWIEYTVRLGDTLDGLSKRFGISTDTIAWSNDIVYVNRLFPGDTLTILPEDGVLHKANGSETIQQMADSYKISPIRIIDSEYNPRLQSAGATPSTILPPDYLVMIPGGVSEKKLLFWSPPVKVVPGGAGGRGGGFVTFGVGQAGSCGAVVPGAGTGSFLLPLPAGSYNVTRGFSGTHGGIDLSGRAGTTVFAADSGSVMYAGWVNYGYGNVVVLNHGNLWTIYGHLSSISVNCGQSVAQGQVIGATGSTGNSSGPHLHFEVRVPAGNQWVPANPTGYRSF